MFVTSDMGGREGSGHSSFPHVALNERPGATAVFNCRYFVISRSPLQGGLRAMRESEVVYTILANLANHENESPWRYLRGLYQGKTELLGIDNQIQEVCLKILKTNQNSVFAISLLLDLLCNGFQPSGKLRGVIAISRNL
ncbi:uncharacterized protein A4U43_C07F17180 [Asparagus officinalis]|uniref:Uncharacterized protein n=1 Tax=Asparagus officinalis TaxID=4686 RepID=A0A5P1ECQ3_ASPOF|nr:uncharacterized protein A4U43_C07F17180 [Asparagus officinalis]